MNDAVTLLGSDVQPAEFDFNGNKATLGEVVAHAHEQSGLSVEDWNALPNEDREAKIQAVVDEFSKPSFEQLKARADELGVQYAGNIGYDTLAARVAEAEDDEAPADDTPPGRVVTDFTVPHNFNSSDKGQDGTAAEQAARVAESPVVTWDNQADLRLANLVSRGHTVAAARHFIEHGEWPDAEED